MFFISTVQWTKTSIISIFPNSTHPAKIDLNKKWLPKQKTIQNFNIDAQGFGKTRNENPPTRILEVTT